jgi:cell division protein FtsL
VNRFPEHQQNARIRRTRDVTALSRLSLLLFSGLVLAAGFVLAAKQHFAAVQYGYKSESLRSERKKLIEENQRLALERDRVSAPARLEPAARQLGLQPATAGQIAKAESAKSQAPLQPKRQVAEKTANAKKVSTH